LESFVSAVAHREASQGKYMKTANEGSVAAEGKTPLPSETFSRRKVLAGAGAIGAMMKSCNGSSRSKMFNSTALRPTGHRFVHGFYTNSD
jgi:hypothetical protein